MFITPFITPWNDKEFGLQAEELEAEYTEDEKDYSSKMNLTTVLKME